MKKCFGWVDEGRSTLVFLGLVSAVSLCHPEMGFSQEPNSAAVNVLIVEAGQLIRSADETVSLGDRIAMLEEARDKLESVVDNYPAHDLALRLATGQPIGAISFAAVEEAIRSTVRGCWTDPTMACVSRLVEQQAASSRVCVDKRVYFAALELAWMAVNNSERADDAMRRRSALDGSCSSEHDTYNIYFPGNSTLDKTLDIQSVASTVSTSEQVTRLMAIDRRGFTSWEKVFDGLLMGGSFSVAAEMAEDLNRAVGNPIQLFELALAQARDNVLNGSSGYEQFEEAIRIAVVAGESDWLMEIAERQAALGLAESALETVDVATDVHLSNVTYEWNSRQLPQIARAQVEIGDIEGALRTLQRAAEETSTILDHGKRSERLRDISEVQFTIGRSEDALSSLEDALSVSLAITALTQPSESSIQVPEVQAQREQLLQDAWRTLDGALDASREIEDVDTRSDSVDTTVSTVVRHRLISGNTAGAEDAIALFSSTGHGPRARAFAVVGSSFAASGQTENAQEAFANMRVEISSIEDPIDKQ